MPYTIPNSTPCRLSPSRLLPYSNSRHCRRELLGGRVCIEAEVGLIETVTGGALTVTVAQEDIVVSATLVAFTVYEPAVVGAVYRPELEMLPPVADQVTAVF